MLSFFSSYMLKSAIFYAMYDLYIGDSNFHFQYFFTFLSYVDGLDVFFHCYGSLWSDTNKW